MQLNKKSVARNYAFLAVMLGSMILGSVVGWIFPQELDAEGNVIRAGATVLEPLGTLFLNMMFCIVVPLVFASISSAVANMKSRKRAGKIMGTTVATFVVTGAIAAVISSKPGAYALERAEKAGDSGIPHVFPFHTFSREGICIYHLIQGLTNI